VLRVFYLFFRAFSARLRRREQLDITDARSVVEEKRAIACLFPKPARSEAERP